MSDADPITTGSEAPEHDAHFEPLVKLDAVETKTLEEDETVFFKIRTKLFRFDKTASEWKERGVGELRLLQHITTKKIRIVMRREKTLKVCANHYITKEMSLAPNVGSDRSWVYNVAADVSDGDPTAETLAVRFSNSENAKEFKDKFEEAQKYNNSLASGSVDATEAPKAATTSTADTTSSTPVDSTDTTDDNATPKEDPKPEVSTDTDKEATAA